MRLLVLIAFYFLFIVIGASIFSAIEAPHENSVIRKLRAKRAQFLEEHPCVKVLRVPERSTAHRGPDRERESGEAEAVPCRWSSTRW